MRLLFGTAGVALLPAAVFLASAGDIRGGLAAALVAVGAFLVAGWAWARPTVFPGRDWVAFAFIAGGIAVLTRPAIVAAAFAGFVLFALGATVYVARSVRRLELEPVDADAVTAKAAVSAFEEEGFRCVGGYRCRVAGRRVMLGVLVVPDRDRFAIVTDLVCEVVSRVGRRWLVTTSSGVAPLPPEILRQELPGASPAALAQGHQAALDLLARRQRAPDRYRDHAEALELARALEQRAARFVSAASVKTLFGIETRRRVGDPALGEDEASRRRIAAWLNAEPPD